MKRRGFTLVELLVAISIILVMATLAGSAYSGARLTAKVSTTRTLIEQLNSVLVGHLSAYDSVPVDVSNPPGGMSPAAYRAWYIRRDLITGDMPDRWTDVEYMASAAWTPRSAPQRTYVGIWQSLTAAQRTQVPQFNGSAECLFMVVMRGGIGDCLDCGPLRNAQVGDQDGDGMPEFWDSWGNPIGYLLWAPALELPPESGKRFFTGARSLDADPFATSGSIRPTLGMRPLIYSTGPDGRSGLERNAEAVTLGMGTGPVGRDCGNPLGAGGTAGGPSLDSGNLAQYRNDNVTNLDLEAKP
jgi:prepilin-type N-terminal cleavage/methylation domain-containing protein